MDGKLLVGLKRYGVAAALPGLALILRSVLPFPEGAGIYQLPLAAVVLSAWYGGRGPGLLASVISIIGAMYLVPPAGSFAVHADHALPLSIFAALCLLLTEFSAGRRRGEHELRASEERFRTLVQFSFDAWYWETDAQHRFIRQELSGWPSDAPPFPRAQMGKTRWEHPSVDGDEPAWREHRATVDAHMPFRDFERAVPTADGGKRYHSVSGIPVFDEAGRFVGYRGVGRDITERKRAEAERRAHVWFLESMDRIHRAMQGTNDLEKMMSGVLEAVLEVFGCDRAWLVYPCDQDAPSWRAVMEHTRQEFPGAFALGTDLPMTADTADVFRSARAARGAVLLGAGYELQTPAHIAERFSIRSQMIMALLPKGEQPYLFGLHQCSRERAWTNEEQRLFEEIGHRLADALSSLIAIRSLRESEARFRRLTDLSVDGYWKQDENLRFTHSMDERHGFEARSLGKLRWELPFTPLSASWDEHRAVLAARKPFRNFVYTRVHPDGTTRYISVSGVPAFDDQGAFKGYDGVASDITARTLAEAERRVHLWFFESLDRINRAMQGTNDLDRMLADVLDAVLEIFASDRAWLLYPCDPDAPSWRAVMERTSPQFPGAAARGRDLPMTPEFAEVARAALKLRGALPAGPDHPRQVKPQSAEHFGVQSEILMALCPKGDRPYLFGLHQCSQPRAWTKEEQRLFEEIGHRLADALASVIAFRGLRESENRLEAAQRVAHIGWWERDYATGHVSLSDEASRIFGVQPVDLPHWHGRWVSLIHPEDRGRAAAASEIALAGGPRYDVEYRVVRPDGTVRVVHSQGDVTRDESGRAVRQFGVLQDITELRQTERRLEAAQRLARVGWWERDYVGHRMLISDEIADIYGIARKERAIDLAEWMKLLPRIIHPEDYPRVFAASQAALRGGPRYDIEYRVVHAEGAVRVVHSQADVTLGESRRPVRQFGVAQDITELRQAEQELRASEARFRTFVDHATDAFFLHDQNLTVIDVNRQACESLGYTREELIGMHPREFDAGLNEASIAQLARRVGDGDTVTFETLHRRKDGIAFPVEIRARKFDTREKRFHLSFARDISERKLAEETLRGKDNALQTARTELARVSRLTTLGELTASIAHEVNQPIGAMATNAAACARWLAAKPPDIAEAQAALQNIVADGKRAGEVIGRIRALTRRQAPRMELLDINRKVLEVVALADHELRSQDIVLRTELAPTLPSVAGDRVQLQQVLLNLIVNAIEAMSGVRDRPRELTMVSRSDADAVVVEVRDSGPGLNEGSAERVFEPFYTTKAQGIGIGLSISRSIVEAHGGRLWAASNQPHGSVFRFSLPVAEDAAA